jgi:hypothetical protein
MSGKIQSGTIHHDPEAFVLALASAHVGHHVKMLSGPEADRWQRVAMCAVEHLARDAAASAAAGAAEAAQGAVMKILERMLDILTPEQSTKMMAIVAELMAGKRG